MTRRLLRWWLRHWWNKMNDRITIYALAHPDKPQLVRYVGKTRKPLHRRLCEHVAERNKNLPTCHRRNWVKKLFSEGKRPVIWPIENCTNENWQDREKHWIAFFKPIGLVNKTDGGDGGTGNKGWKWKPSAILKISMVRRITAKTPAQKAVWEKIKEGQKGRRRSPESIEKTASKNRGIKRTPEQIERYRLARTGKKQNLSESQRKHRGYLARKYLKWPVGKPRPKHSQEWKDKMRARMIGRKITWDTSSKRNRDITTPILRAFNESRKKKVVGSDGRVFQSIADARRALGVSERGFRDCVKNGWRVKGVYWKIQKKEESNVSSNNLLLKPV